MPECITDVNTLLSQSVMLLDRDIRNAIDVAVHGLGRVMQSISAKNIDT